MFIKFSEETQKVLKKAKLEMQKLHHSFIGSEHVILSILNSSNSVSKKLNEYKVNYNIFKKELIKTIGVGKSKNNYFIYTPLLKRVIENAILDAKDDNLGEVGIEQLFISILDEGEGVGIRLLYNLGVNIDKLYEEFNKKGGTKSNKKLLVSEYGIDLNKKALDGKIDPLIGREKEVNEIIEVLLRKNKNNPLLIGEAGVGKTAIVEELAKRITQKMVPDKLKNAKIYSLSMASLVSGTKYRGEFEEKVSKLLKELENNQDTILFIDEIHTIVGAGGAEGAIDASNILKPALARNSIKLIGATTINEYKTSIQKDKALNRRFQVININENTLEETKKILYQLKNIYENYHRVILPDIILDKIVYLTDKYVTDKNNPDKSIDLLDMVCTKVSLNDRPMHKIDKLEKELNEVKKKKNNLIINHSFNEAYALRTSEIKLESEINSLNLSYKNSKRKDVTINDLCNVLESKIRIPLFEIKKDNHQLVKIDDYMKKKIIGQDNIIMNINKSLRRIMFGLKNDLPSSFLFVGKSGVGKTMLVKEYSNYLNIPLIRLDMSEYKEAHTISKIIGSPPGYIGYNDVDIVLEKVKNNPYSIILLDEIEKACNEVINLFLQILDEGIIMDSHGNKVSFKNTIIIMTSNIGSEKDNIGFNNNHKTLNELREILSTPFVNRINKIFYFNDLKNEDILKILKNKLKSIRQKYRENDITLHVEETFIKKIINDSEYEKYGARKACKLLEEQIDDLIIDNLLKGKKEISIKN